MFQLFLPCPHLLIVFSNYLRVFKELPNVFNIIMLISFICGCHERHALAWFSLTRQIKSLTPKSLSGTPGKISVHPLGLQNKSILIRGPLCKAFLA